MDAPGTRIVDLGKVVDTRDSRIVSLGTTTTTVRSVSPVIKRTVVTKVTQPEEEYYQLGSNVRDSRFADKVISVGG